MRRFDRWFGPRAVVALTSAVAVLSFLTGVANIGTVSVGGPVAPYVPSGVQQAVGFTGALTGFLMLASVFGMRRRLRAAWYSTAILLPMTALQGVIQLGPHTSQILSQLSLPLVILSALSLPAVALSRDRFDRDLQLSKAQLAALSALVGSQVYGTVGTWALRDAFADIDTITDAFYFTIVTSSTVGYGDISPLTQGARLFSMSLVVVGVASFGLAAGSLLGPAIESRLSKALGTMTESQLDLLEDHVLVLGYGDLTEPVLDELQAQATFVVITPSPETASELGNRGMNVLTDDPSDEEPLQKAGIEDARAVVAATNDDAQDALAILTARQLNPEVRIVAGVTQRENLAKLKRAGADSVISPAVIGGHLLVQSALGDDQANSIAEKLLGS